MSKRLLAVLLFIRLSLLAALLTLLTLLAAKSSPLSNPTRVASVVLRTIRPTPSHFGNLQVVTAVLSVSNPKGTHCSVPPFVRRNHASTRNGIPCCHRLHRHH